MYDLSYVLWQWTTFLFTHATISTKYKISVRSVFICVCLCICVLYSKWVIQCGWFLSMHQSVLIDFYSFIFFKIKCDGNYHIQSTSILFFFCFVIFLNNMKFAIQTQNTNTYTTRSTCIIFKMMKEWNGTEPRNRVKLRIKKINVSIWKIEKEKNWTNCNFVSKGKSKRYDRVTEKYELKRTFAETF